MTLLDTNVVSEVMVEQPDRCVLAWVDAQPEEDLWTSSIVAAEAYTGLELMPAGRRQEQLRAKIEEMFLRQFDRRILSFRRAEAQAYGNVLRVRRSIGKPIDEMDALIAGLRWFMARRWQRAT
ncbi:MAG TPA: PIN domain-containing protein [Terracidiphilus sp.]|jgi:hypothetical protein|nr:PIN domain-containing protein [Terracidiphilus sp.]